MFFLQFKKIARWSGLRAVLLGTMWLITFLFPEFLKGGIIYAVAAYAIFNGVLGIVDFLSGRGKEETHIVNLNLLVMLAEIIFGILCIVYFRYLISILPVFLGVLLMIESVMYFIAAFCVKCKLKVLIVILSLLVGAGGVMLVIFTFGFGGLRPLVKIFSSLLFLSCITELLISSCGKA
ncbi:MAG: hypothetical protein K2K07_10350 [Lachnospiraceae bacterium]|nr:hypothetical protein [Lachnospiraceae bacterium]